MLHGWCPRAFLTHGRLLRNERNRMMQRIAPLALLPRTVTSVHLQRGWCILVSRSRLNTNEVVVVPLWTVKGHRECCQTFIGPLTLVPLTKSLLLAVWRQPEVSSGSAGLLISLLSHQQLDTNMTVYDFYLFDRNGNCLYYAEWNRRKQPGISKEEVIRLMIYLFFHFSSLSRDLTVLWNSPI